MNFFLSIIIFILVLLFIPIPFKFNIYFSNDEIYIKLYKFTILKKSFNKVSDEIVSQNKPTKIKNKKIKKHTESKTISLSNKGKIKFISLMNKNKFKPKLYIKGFFEYSLDDAAITAISFGVLNTYLPLLRWILSIVFKIKKLHFPITPVFKDNVYIHSEINCIFTISIAKTILIAILIITNYINVKGDELERE